MSERPPDPSGPQPTDPYAYPPPPGWGTAPGWSAPPPSRDRLGMRSRRRPDLRVGVTLAGAGAALVLIGAAEWSGGYYAAGGGSRRFLGGLLFAGLTAAGYALAIRRRQGALATAGAVAAAFALPLTFVFLTLDPAGMGSDGYPFNLDLVFLLAIAVWLATYLVVPGLRGRALFLGAAAVGLFDYLTLKATDLPSPARLGGFLVDGGGGPDLDSLTAVGLLCGLAYYTIAVVLDARGRAGAAVALAVAGFQATLTGVIAGAVNMGQAGTGVLLIVLGAVLSSYGARFGRRFTSWAWAAAIVVGVGLVAEDLFGDGYAGNGLTLIVVGIAVVGAAYALSAALRETPEIDEGLAAAG